MESATGNNPCLRCVNGTAQVLCDGCQEWLCIAHLLEHRQELDQDVNRLCREHDEMHRQRIDDDYQKSLLFSRINIWEQKAINRIRANANKAREDVRNHLSRNQQASTAFNTLTEELHKKQSQKSYTELNVKRWLKQLDKLRKRLERPWSVEILHEDEDMSDSIVLIQAQRRADAETESRDLHLFLPQHNSKWNPRATTLAVSPSYALSRPFSLQLADGGQWFISDTRNHRILKGKLGNETVDVVVGRDKTLERPTAILIDAISNSLIVSDGGHQRILRCSREQGAISETLLSNRLSFGLAFDDESALYVSDATRNEVRRYRTGDTVGKVVAGGHGRGDGLNQFDYPRNIFLDTEHALYVSDTRNNRVMKWARGAKQGTVVAGGRGEGNRLSQLHFPAGLYVDAMGSVYVVDQGNHRVVRWTPGSQEGELIVGGIGSGSANNQLRQPSDLAFDRQGNLYVVDGDNDRIQRFTILDPTC